MTNFLNQNQQGFNTQNWLQALNEHQSRQTACVLVTVLSTDGSTPREAGAKMLVSTTAIYDTIGGGHLEFEAIKRARKQIQEQSNKPIVESFPLGAKLGQCCGGKAQLLFEYFAGCPLQLHIFGAGHVAQALIKILAGLPLKIYWVDSRQSVFPEYIPPNVEQVIEEEPEFHISQATPNSAYLVLTHNHQLDFELCQNILKREDARWLGLIGSQTKAKRFHYRLQQCGINSRQLEKLQCPVGLPEISGKKPMEVAVSIAAELIQLYQNVALEQPRHNKEESC
ncbi:xanthine dehydrogenase accessory protein XdhC [Gayadomonas joobiniege]|uniref:xanthine dehydrogenase accessory protein XdhC n=1 Tax=Gayadomonas joobiniege TaxID=1234606 RepID=UPI000371259E|nr:xanthine dehydrogenase accessory protein XdhC [Gayadomonas joobiniege]